MWWFVPFTTIPPVQYILMRVLILNAYRQIFYIFKDVIFADAQITRSKVNIDIGGNALKTNERKYCSLHQIYLGRSFGMLLLLRPCRFHIISEITFFAKYLSTN